MTRLRIVIALSATVVLLVGLAIWYGPVFRCHDDVVHQEWAPDHRHVAAIAIRDCGATTGLSTQIVVSPHAIRAPIRNNEIAFVTDDSVGVRFHWSSSDTLIIRVGAGEIFRDSSAIGAVRVRYDR